MSDWAHREAMKLRKAIDEKTAKVARFQERQKINRQQGQSKWEEVQKEIITHCNIFNTEMGSKVLEVLPTENGGLRIKANANQIFCDYNVAFKGDAGPLEWQVQNGVPNGKYDLVITEGGDAVFRDSGNPSIFLTPQSVAEAIISSLLDSVSQL